jgi:putative ABC transport system permease protein
VITIAVVVAIGVAGFVGMFAVHDSLKTSRDAFYRDNRLADVFAGVKRAPVSLGERSRPSRRGRGQLDVVFDAQVDLPGVVQPVTGRFIGLDLSAVQAGRQGLNALSLKQGRWPERGAALEALVSDRFAAARRPQARRRGARHPQRPARAGAPGGHGGFARIRVRLAGRRARRHQLRHLVDRRQRMTEAFDMQGAFNQVSLRLDAGCPKAPCSRAGPPARTLRQHRRRGARPAAVTKIVSDELAQLKVMGTVLPAIFLAVAMFILNVVLSRQVATQRSQIAALKALGYSDGAIAWHYIQLALVIAGLGVVVGLGLSQLIGRGMLGLYDEVFRFNRLAYATDTGWCCSRPLIAALAAAAGTWTAIHAVVRLRPAQAMQPPAPPAYPPR